MTFTIMPTTGQAKPAAVPRKGNQYDYSFLKDMPNGAVAAIHCGDRAANNVRRSAQYARKGGRTMVIDNVLLVW